MDLAERIVRTPARTTLVARPHLLNSWWAWGIPLPKNNQRMVQCPVAKPDISVRPSHRRPEQVGATP